MEMTSEATKSSKLLKIFEKGLIATKYGLELGDEVLKSGVTMAGCLVLNPVAARVGATLVVNGAKIGVDKALDSVRQRMSR